MLQDLSRAFAELGDPRARKVVLLGVGLAILTLIALIVGTNALLDWAMTTRWAWLDTIVEVLGVLGTAVVAWFLFPGVVVAISSLFLERIVDATEDRYFPDLPPPRSVSVIEAAGSGLRLLALALALNILALPVYFVPLLNFPVWVLLNGYLVGREYAELVGMRRLDRPKLAVLLRQQRWQFWTAGMVIAVLLAVPFLNLVVPVVGAAFMTQRFHRKLGPVVRQLQQPV